MKTLRVDFLNLEIEVPDDYPDDVLDFEGHFRYIQEHPEVGDKIMREYKRAQNRWLKTKEAKEFFARLGRPPRLDGRPPQQVRR